MNKKLLKLLKKNNSNELNKDVYSSDVNNQITKKYPYGEEHAIIRKTIYLLLEDLIKYGVDITKYNEFINYYNNVENYKANSKEQILK